MSIKIGWILSFVESVEICLKKYSDFSGTASRNEYWWFFLFSSLLVLVAAIADAILFGTGDSIRIIGSLVYLGLLLPGLAVGTRRLHAINKSGWWQLLWLGSLLLIPMIYLIVLMSSGCECNESQNLREL